MVDTEAERQARREVVAAAICLTVVDKPWAKVKKEGHVSFVQKMFAAADAAIKAYESFSTKSAERENIPF